MKSIKSYVQLAAAVAAVFALSSFAGHSSLESPAVAGVDFHTHVQGKRCTGTVGCSCPGFSPITDGDEWQKAYCRHCKHKRSCHR